MDNFYIAKVASVDENGLTLIMEGEETPTEKKYQFLTSYTPAVDDRVLVIATDDTYIVAGKFGKVPGGGSDPVEASGSFDSGYGHWKQYGKLVVLNYARPTSLANNTIKQITTGAPVPAYEIQTVANYGNAAETAVTLHMPAWMTTGSQLKIYNQTGSALTTTNTLRVGFVYMTN